MTLGQLRKRIDRVDRKILKLLNERASVARRIGDLKRRRALPVFDGKRESAVLRRMSRSSGGPLSSAAVQAVFRVILRHNRRLQSRGSRSKD